MADTYSDANYGDGRKTNNPDGYSELRSGELARAHALSLGYDPGRADRMHDMMLGTAFDEHAKAQAGKLTLTSSSKPSLASICKPWPNRSRWKGASAWHPKTTPRNATPSTASSAAP